MDVVIIQIIYSPLYENRRRGISVRVWEMRIRYKPLENLGVREVAALVKCRAVQTSPFLQERIASIQKSESNRVLGLLNQWKARGFNRITFFGANCFILTCRNALSSPPLEFAVPRCPGEGDHVADVAHAGDEEHQPLKAQPEAAVGSRAEPAGV